MITKRELVIAILTLCLTATLFTILPAGSKYSTSGMGEYDPWLDSNEDGRINILEAIILGGSFGTAGDPTKNVNVINWPTKRTLNASLADNLVIGDGEWQELEANVEGYSKVTLVLNRHTSGGTLMVVVRFKIGGVGTPIIYSNNSFTTEPHFLLQNYEVIGPTIIIEIGTFSGPITVSLGIYATE